MWMFSFSSMLSKKVSLAHLTEYDAEDLDGRQNQLDVCYIWFWRERGGGGNISQNCTLAMFWYSFQWNLNWAHLRLAHPSSLKSLHGKVRRLFLEERFSNTVLGSFMLWKLKITMQRQWQGPHLTKLGKANPCSPFRRSFSRLTRPSLCTRWARTCVKEPVKNYLAIFFR